MGTRPLYEQSRKNTEENCYNTTIMKEQPRLPSRVRCSSRGDSASVNQWSVLSVDCCCRQQAEISSVGDSAPCKLAIEAPTTSLFGAATLSPAVAPPWRLFTELSYGETSAILLQLQATTTTLSTVFISEKWIMMTVYTAPQCRKFSRTSQRFFDIRISGTLWLHFVNAKTLDYRFIVLSTGSIT